jgi:hypothetical protein
MNAFATGRRLRFLAGVGVFALALCLAAFVLPLLLPPTKYLVSTSYSFGFNNGVAVLAIALVLGAASLVWLAAAPGRGALVRYEEAEGAAPERLPLRLLGLLAGVYVLLTCAAFVYTQRSSAGWLTWEVRHFVHRMRLMEHYDLRPYIDFSSEYGPLLAYAPSAVHAALAPLGVSDLGAYFVTHLLLNLAGLGCLFFLATHAAGPARRRGLAFAAVGLAGFAPYMGLNGVTLRYVLPLASILVGHRLLRRLESHAVGSRLAATAAVVALLAGANVVVSPEVGVAFALGWLGYSALAVRSDWRVLAGSLAGLAVAALSARLCLPAEYLGSLLRFGAGANNLPLVPAAHIVFYLLTLALLVPPAVAAGLRGATRDAPLLGALAATSVVLMPGALGRADPPHVLLYGLGPSLLLLLALARAPSARPQACFAAGYVVVSIALFNLVNLINFFGLPVRQLVTDPLGAARSFVEARRAELAPRDLSFLPALDKYPGIGVPFATYGGDHDVEAYLFRERLLGPEYFIGAVGVYTEDELARKLADVARFEHLLVSGVFQRPWKADRGAEKLRRLRRWYLYPARLTHVRDDLDSDGDIVRFIAAHFEPVEELGPVVVMRRKAIESKK